MLVSLYQPADSWLYRMDPRVKLLLVVCGLAVIFSLANAWLMIAAILLEQALLLSARVATPRLVWVWRMIWWTVVLVFVLWVLFYPVEAAAFWSWGPVHLSHIGLALGAVVALRLAAVAFLLFGWLFTTSEVELILSLQWLGLPYMWGLTLAMALRYVPTMAELFRMTEDAQQARGLDLARRSPLAKARAYVPITVAMLISALRMATNLAHALDARALGATRQRTSLQSLCFRAVDGLWVAAILGLTLGWLWLRFALGWGASPL